MTEPSRKHRRAAGAARLASFYLVVFRERVVQIAFENASGVNLSCVMPALVAGIHVFLG
jgi:hypothetical protein